MWIIPVAFVQLLLVAGNFLLAESGCSPGFTYPLNRQCRFYLKCDDGLLKMTKCHPGRYFDVSTRSCVPGDSSEGCERQNIDFGSSKMGDVKSRMARDMRRFKDGPRTPWPFMRQSTDDDYWTGTDSGLTGTQWSYNSQTTEGNYWTGTDGTVMTGTMWPFARTTSNGDVSGFEWMKRATTEDNYWTGTDNPGLTGTLWPDQSITTDGNYWTGTDSTATGTLWPVGTITTRDSSRTSTERAPTVTYFPTITESPPTGTYFPTITESPPTGTYFPTFTESSVTYPFSTETVPSFTVTDPTESPWMTSTQHSTSQTGTEWTVTENHVTDATASEWTPRPLGKENLKTTTPAYV